MGLLRKFPLCLMSLVFLAPGLAGSAGRWTFMVYLDGDNNLENPALDDFLEMAEVGSTSEVNIVVQLDRGPRYSTRFENWEDTQRFHVTTGMEPRLSQAIADWGDGRGGREVNMGDPAVLRDFITWTITNYPAENYALVLWDHGSGWRDMTEQLASLQASSRQARTPEERKHLEAEIRELARKIRVRKFLKSVCSDDTSGDELTVKELRLCLEEIPQVISIIGFDACLMGMLEVAYELKDEGQIMVASEEVEDLAGWPFNTLLADLRANPTWDPKQFATCIVNRYGQYYAGGSDTLSAVDLALMDQAGTALDEFVQAMTNAGNQWLYIYTALLQTRGFDEPDYKDFPSFLQNLESGLIEPQMVAVTRNLKEILDSAVVANFGGPSSLGLSIYFPDYRSGFDADYNQSNLRFCGLAWDEFLQVFLTANLTAGYSVLYREDFSQGLPASWTVVDGYSDGKTWTAANPRKRDLPQLTKPFMIVDSDWAGRVLMDEQLISPVFDFPGCDTVLLKFDQDFNYYTDEYADVDVRVNSGDWQNVISYQGRDVSGMAVIDISSQASAGPIQIRWHYYNANYEWWWAIDNVEFLVASVKGDLDGNGAVNIQDVILCLRMVLGLEPEDPSADMDGSGTVDILDVFLILEKAIGLN